MTRKKRIARAVAVWINVAKSQLVKDAGITLSLPLPLSFPLSLPPSLPPSLSLSLVFLRLLKELQDSLEADSLTEELEILDSSLSESIRSSILGKHTHSPILSASLNQMLSKVCNSIETCIVYNINPIETCIVCITLTPLKHVLCV